VYLKSFVDGVEQEAIKVDGEWVIVPWWFWSSDPKYVKHRREMFESANEVVRGILEAIAAVPIMANPYFSYLFKVQRQDGKFAVKDWEERSDIWTPTVVYCLDGKVDYLEHSGMNRYAMDISDYQTNFLRFGDNEYKNIFWATDNHEKLEKDAKKFRDSGQSPRNLGVVRSSSADDRLEMDMKVPADIAKSSYSRIIHSVMRLGEDARDSVLERVAMYGLKLEEKLLVKMAEVEEGVPSLTSIGTSQEWYKFLGELQKAEKEGVDAKKFLRTPEAAKKLKELVLSATRAVKVYDGFREWALTELLREWRVEKFAEDVAKSLLEDSNFATIVKAGVAHIDRGLKRYISRADQQTLTNSYARAIDVNSYVTARILEEADKVGVIVVYKDKLANLRKDIVARAQSFLATAEREKREGELELAKA